MIHAVNVIPNAVSQIGRPRREPVVRTCADICLLERNSRHRHRCVNWVEELRLWACECDGGFMVQALCIAAPAAVAEYDEGKEKGDGGACCCRSDAYAGCGFGGEAMRAFVGLAEGGRNSRRNYACGWSCAHRQVALAV